MLAMIVMTLTLVAAIGGLWGGVYRDNALVTRGWYGNDAVTLGVALPLMMRACYLSRSGSRRAQLLWLGTLYFTFYNYAFYLFGAAFNAMFLVYVALLISSFSALIDGLSKLHPSGVLETRLTGVMGYLALVGLALGTVHVGTALRYVWKGQLPDVVIATAHPTNLVAALDLSLVVVPSLLAAVWMWRREPWGYVLAVLVTVKGALYMTALTAAVMSAVGSGALVDGSEAWLWAGLGLGSLISAVSLLRSVGSSDRCTRKESAQWFGLVC
jgi:hypothetical protein